MGTSAWDVLVSKGMAAMIVTGVFSIFLAVLVLWLAFRLVIGYVPSFSRSLMAVLVSDGIVLLLGVAASLALPNRFSAWWLLPLQFLIGVYVVNQYLLTKFGKQIGYVKAGIVELLFMGVCFLLAMLFSATLAV